MRKSARCFLAALSLAGAGPAFAQATEAWQAPTLSITRYDEDWSDLADPEKRAHHWTGPFKYIPVDDDAYIVTGIELRARVESYDDNLWGGGDAPNDAYLWLRAMPYADLHTGAVRAFVQPIAAYAVGVAPSAGPIDQTRVDLLQGFADVDLGPVTVRGGRQMLSLGTERLVGTRYGPNVPLAFDGGRVIVTIGKARVNLLAVRPVTPGTGTFDDRTSSSKALWGVYTTLPGLDLYYLGYRNDAARFGGRTGRETRHSLGMRVYGARGGWHWNIEGIGQFGRFAGETIGAWTLGTEVGRSFASAPSRPTR